MCRPYAMKTASLFLVHCLIATGFAKPAVFLGYQDSLGQYSFGYSAPGSARSEVRTSNGATRGTYSYVDETGVIQTAQYVADSDGFRVFATNLPQAPLPVQDTPEVMAARTAHLQALELATRRDEQAQNREDAQEKKLESNQGDANLDKTQEQLEAKFVKNQNDSAKKIDEKDNESLQAVASRSSVDKASDKNSQEIREESSGKVTEEIVSGANIPATPLISSRVLLPQTSGENTVPIFRISHGIYEIEPSAIPETSIQGISGRITPAATILKSTAISGNQAATGKEQQKQRANEPVVTVDTIAPSSAIPLSSSHSSFIRYESPVFLHYVAYNIL